MLDPFEAARAYGHVANEEAAMLDAVANWAGKALPGLLRGDHGPWFVTYLGTHRLHEPTDVGSFLAPAAASRRVQLDPRGRSTPLGREALRIINENGGLRPGVDPLSVAVAFPIVGERTVLLRPRVAPAGDQTEIIVTRVWDGRAHFQPMQASAHHHMVQLRELAEFALPEGLTDKYWVFVRRSLVHPRHLIDPVTCPMLMTPATSGRTGCWDAPMNAERAKGWAPVPLNWTPGGDDLRDYQRSDAVERMEEDNYCPISVDQMLVRLAKHQPIPRFYRHKLVALHKAALIEFGKRGGPHPLAPFHDEPDILASSEAGKARRIAGQSNASSTAK